MDRSVPPTAAPSPCINVCRMDAASGLCSGCWRTLDEIAAWSRLPDAARWQVLSIIAERQRSSGLSPSRPAGADDISSCENMPSGCQG